MHVAFPRRDRCPFCSRTVIVTGGRLERRGPARNGKILCPGSDTPAQPIARGSARGSTDDQAGTRP